MFSPFGSSNIDFSFLMFISVLGLSVYFTLIPGLFIFSKYTVLGRVRALVQTVSYEVAFFILLLDLLLLFNSFQINAIFYPFFVFTLLGLPLIAVSWLLTSLAERGRAPFDFREGESELVSGFNTEYSSAPFAIFFIGEYGFLILIRVILRLFFLGGWSLGFLFIFVVIIAVSLFVWVRSSFPRLRFDLLIDLAWLDLLPISLLYLVFVWLLVLT